VEVRPLSLAQAAATQPDLGRRASSAPGRVREGFLGAALRLYTGKSMLHSIHVIVIALIGLVVFAAT
jgi:hypothetical protein